MSNVYSIWLIPEGEDREKLQKVVNTLAGEFGAPVFQPHITIVPDYEAELNDILDVLPGLSWKSRGPLKITFSGPSIGESYYRSVYMLAEKSPELLELFSSIRNQIKFEGDVFPHMSLIYGDFDVETRKKISNRAIELLPKQFSFGVSKITLFNTPRDQESGDRVSTWKWAGEVFL
jgi:2'-5' RNA ligase